MRYKIPQPVLHGLQFHVYANKWLIVKFVDTRTVRAN